MAASAPASGVSGRDGLRRRVPTALEHRPAAGSLAALAAFVAVAYALSWGWTLPFAAVGDVIEKGKGWPTHWPALLGPAIAAIAITAWTSGRVGLTDLFARMCRWRVPLRWWAAAMSPLVFLAIALAIAAAADKLPRSSDFGRFSGMPTIGIVGVALLVLVGGLGEETGWRGFALPLLQRRHGALVAALLVTPIWALWHLPLFFTVTSYRDFAPGAFVGFAFALACGSIVLTWLYNRSGGSIVACGVWHGLFNLTTATAAATGTIAAVVSMLVIVQALALVWLELRARRQGRPSILGPLVAEQPSLVLGAAP